MPDAIKKQLWEQKEVIMYEIKNWSQWYPETIWKQFIRDIQAIQNLEELKWVFHKTSGVNKDNLKEKIISTLKKPDGTPVDEIKNLFAKRKAHTKIQEIFGQTTTTPEKLLDKLNSNNIFDEVFIVID